MTLSRIELDLQDYRISKSWVDSRLDRLGERADLVDLEQERVALALGKCLLDTLRVGDQEIVADNLNLVAKLLGDLNPVGEVVLLEGVLDRDHFFWNKTIVSQLS